MTAAPPSRGLEVDATVAERYRVLQVVETDVWGGTYVVCDLREPSLHLVLKQIIIPPLRKELEARLDMFGEALKALHQVRHAAIAPVVDFFQADGTLYVVYEMAAGPDLGASLASGRLPREPHDQVRVAICVAEALQALIAAGQHQAVTAFSLRHVILLGKGRAALVSLGVGHFLRPFGTPWKPPPAAEAEARAAFDASFEQQAVRRVGQVLHALVTRKAWTDTTVITAESLPESLGPVLMRALRSGGGDGYATLDALIRDLSMLYNVQRLDVWEWKVSETPPPPPPWEKIGIGAFAVRSTAIGLRALRTRALRQRPFTIAVEVLLLISLLGYAFTREREQVPTDYVRSAPVVYVACANGSLQIWDARTYTRLVSTRLESPPAALARTPAGDRVLVSLPARKRIDIRDTTNNRSLGTIGLQAGCTEIVVNPDARRAWCIGSPSTLLSGIDLTTLRGTKILPLTGACLAAAFSGDGRSLLVSTEAPPRLTLLDPASGAVTARKDLQEAGQRVRVRPDGREIWVVGQTAVKVFDPSLTDIRTIEAKGGQAVDVGWSESAAYLLWRSSQGERGGISRIEGNEMDLNSTVITGPEPARFQVVSDHIAWVSIPRTRTIQVFDLQARRLKGNLVLESVGTDLQWIP